MHKAPLHEKSVDAITNYFAHRPLVSEPWEKKYRLTSQRVERHYWVVYVALLPFVLLGAVGGVLETVTNAQFTADRLISLLYIPVFLGLAYAVHFVKR
ncbi:MAG: hypothetical protein AAFY88_13260 [Acidobacteriota bacterium]